jgi:hypothetical protein
MKPAEKWGLIATVAGVVVAVLAWWFPDAAQSLKPDSAAPSATVAPTGTATKAAAGTGTGTPAVPTPVLLDTEAPQSGKANLTGLPRALANLAGYDHPIVVTCPTNQNDDQVREVTYLLRGRYLDFSATVRPYSTSRPDARANVYAIAGYRERDGTLTRQEKGRQLTAAMSAPKPLTASVERAEELTLQVRCEEPDGVVVLVGAGLTR